MILFKRLPLIDGHRLLTSELAVDSQLSHLAFYDVNHDTVYLLTPIMMLHFMLEYRRTFQTNKNYRIRESLPYHRAIQGGRGRSVFRMFFSTSREGRDQLVIAYFDGSLELFQSRNNWTKVMSHNLDSRIGWITLIESNLYTVSFAEELSAYDVGANCIRVNIPVTHGKSVLAKTKQGLLYEDRAGGLKCGDKTLLAAQPLKEKFFNCLLTVDKEEKDPQNFEISECQRYLIRIQPCSVYSIEVGKAKLKLLFDFKQDPIAVYPSPFNYMIGTVAAVLYDGTLRLIVLEPTDSNQFKAGEAFLEIQELKHDVERLVWISPYSLLIMSVYERLYYLEIVNKNLCLPNDLIEF